MPCIDGSLVDQLAFYSIIIMMMYNTSHVEVKHLTTFFLFSGYLLILKTSGVLLLSEAAALSAGLLTALLTTISGHTLSYYSKPHLVIPLFYVPSVLAMGAVHYWWRRKVR